MTALNQFTVHAVTLRCRSGAEASKGDGVLHSSSFEARKSSHLRMTIQPLSSSFEFTRTTQP
ncbi:hypothetical protein BH10PSE10_BH10PSE10_19730 [soil metagenome]